MTAAERIEAVRRAIVDYVRSDDCQAHWSIRDGNLYIDGDIDMAALASTTIAAVLQSLLEPSEPSDEIMDSFRCASRGEATDFWRAMIQAAIKEHQ